MDNNLPQFDEVTLMAYADHELDAVTSARLKKALIADPELRKRLDVYSSTRYALLELTKKNNDQEIPEHIIQLIDQHDKPEKKKTNNVVQLFWSRPPLALAASLIVGILVGVQGMQIISQPTDDLLLNLPTQRDYSSASHKVNNEPEENLAVSDDTSIILSLLNSLEKNPEETAYSLNISGKNTTTDILSDFTNKQNEQCRLASHKKSYYIACLNSENNWYISKPNN